MLLDGLVAGPDQTHDVPTGEGRRGVAGQP
jgi:hypothetical protein